MFGLQHAYHLSFLSGEGRSGAGAHIVFTVDATHLPTIVEHLRLFSKNEQEHAAEYLEADDDFVFSSPDLFGDMRFGYGACGRAIQDGASVALHVALGRDLELRHAVLTIHLLTMAFMSVMNIRTVHEEKAQRVQFTTCCERNAPYYGHAMGGYVSREFRVWLAAQCPALSSSGYVPVPDLVVHVMRETWCAVTYEDAHQWAQDCRGWISMDGRFTLVCFGNACDISIYPEEVMDKPVFTGARLECHNLDTAQQQLTLLAGLAALSDLSRQRA